MKDWMKNVLLAVLLLLMCGLLAGTMLLSVRSSQGGQKLLSGLSGGSGSTGAGGETALQPAAVPETVALVAEGGVYRPADGESFELLYQQLLPVFQEALGSADGLRALSDSDWQARLRAPAAVMQYAGGIPVYLLRAWSGGEPGSSETPIRTLALAAGEDGVTLLLSDGGNGRWAASTAASSAALEELCGEERDWNACLAGDNDRGLRWDQILTLGVTESAVYTADTPEFVKKGELSARIQGLFSMNSYLTRVYQNSDGSLVYVESQHTLTLTGTGELIYAGSAGADLELSAAGGAARKAELCQKVYARLCELWDAAGASGQLSLERLETPGSDTVVLHFGLWDGGAFCQRSQGDWAVVTVKNGAITGLTAVLRRLEAGESVQLLPMTQAARALDGERAWLCLRRLEQADGSFVPALCRVTED